MAIKTAMFVINTRIYPFSLLGTDEERKVVKVVPLEVSTVLSTSVRIYLMPHLLAVVKFDSVVCYFFELA